MPIPAIAPYPTPEADPAANTVDWAVEPGRCALLIHDAQRYFMAAYDPAESPVAGMYRNIAELRETCAALGVPVYYSAQPGDQDPARRGLLADFWGPGMGDDPSETDIVPELAPGPQDVVVTKWRYSAFQRTELAEALRFSGRDQLIVTGVYAHLGCLATACEAFMRDIEAFVVADAMADFSRAEHAMALDYAARRCGSVTTARRVCDELTMDRARAATGS